MGQKKKLRGTMEKLLEFLDPQQREEFLGTGVGGRRGTCGYAATGLTLSLEKWIGGREASENYLPGSAAMGVIEDSWWKVLFGG